MASIVIGGRSLEVWHRDAPGSLGKLKQTIAAEKALRAAPADADAVAALVLSYVGDNEGVTADWLLGVLPANYSALLVRLVEATGATVAGEAASP